MKIWIGIDPGMEGAIAAIGENGRIDIRDTPTIKAGNKREYDLDKMSGYLRKAVGLHRCVAVIEKVHAMPKQGVSSSFNFGDGFGIWKGAVAALQIPFQLVTPQRWKAVMLDGTTKDKGSAITVASRLFPQSTFPSAIFKTPRGRLLDGRAEALLMAAFCRRMNP